MMKTLRLPTNTIFIPWRLLGGLFLVSIALGILFVLGPFSQRLFDNFVDIFSVIYASLLAFLCFKGSPGLAGAASLSVAGKQTWRRFIPALLGMGVTCIALGLFARVCGTILTQQEPTY